MTTGTLKDPMVRNARAHVALAGLVILYVMFFWKALYALEEFYLMREHNS